MIIETIFKGTLTGISGLVASKTFEKHIINRIPVLEKLIVNHKIPNDKLVELIKFTVNEAFEKFNKKHKGKYIDLFKDENNFNLIMDSFNFNVPMLSFEQFQLTGYGYNKNELKTAIKDFIVIFNNEVSKVSLLDMINGLKKHNEDGTKTNEIVKYLKIELDKLSKKVNCLSNGTNQIINEFNNNLGQIIIANDNATVHATYITNQPKSFNPHIQIMQTNLSMLSSNFTGREEYIAKIESLLTKQDIIILTANGGLGKTQIVLNYINKNEKKYKHIAFINASTGDSITQGYAKLLDIENDENTITRMRNWVNENRNWLFIYDNLDDKKLKENIYESYMISPKNGKIIITSRLSNWNEEKIEINEFELEESISLLNRITKLSDNEGAKQLSKELNNFPLALEQAGSYIKTNDKTYFDYIDLFKDREYKLRILDKEKPDKYHSTIAKTWQISFEKITNKCSHEFLNIISYLDSDNIPKKLFFNGIEKLPKCLKKSLNDKVDSDNVFNQLSMYSLIKVKNDDIFIHKLIQEVVRYSLTEKQQQEFFEISANILYENFAYDYHKQDTWEWSIKLVPHVLNILKISNEYRIDNLNIVSFNYNLGELYYNQGKYEEAESYFKKALAICEKVLGLNHSIAAMSCNYLGLSYFYQGKYDQVETYLKKALAICEKVLDLNHSIAAMSYNYFGILYGHQGKYEKAESYYKKALAICEKMLGLNHPDTAMSYNNLGLSYFYQGKYEEAKSYHKKALDIREKILGLNHPDTAMSYNSLAILYNSQRKYKEAESYHKKALDIREKELGLNHYHTAMSYFNLGLLYDNQSKYKEAETYYKEALAICEKELGTNHPNIKIIKENLEILHEKMGK